MCTVVPQCPSHTTAVTVRERMMAVRRVPSHVVWKIEAFIAGLFSRQPLYLKGETNSDGSIALFSSSSSLLLLLSFTTIINNPQTGFQITAACPAVQPVIVMLMRCPRYLTLVYISWPVVKLVLFFVISLTVIETIQDIKWGLTVPLFSLSQNSVSWVGSAEYLLLSSWCWLGGAVIWGFHRGVVSKMAHHTSAALVGMAGRLDSVGRWDSSSLSHPMSLFHMVSPAGPLT